MTERQSVSVAPTQSVSNLGSNFSIVFLWYGSFTAANNALQTNYDARSGKFSFKESALDKTNASPDVNFNRTTRNFGGTQSSRNLSASSRSGLNSTTAVPSVLLKPPIQQQIIPREDKCFKWTSIVGCEDQSNIAELCKEKSSDCSVIIVGQSGLYLVQFVTFNCTNDSKNSVV